MPGMAISRIRQLVCSMQSDARNSSADENARTAKPNSRSKSGSDSRTDSSSSTTETRERFVVIVFCVALTATGFGDTKCYVRERRPYQSAQRLDRAAVLASHAVFHGSTPPCRRMLQSSGERL